MKDNLTREIIRRIFLNVGASPFNLGKVGLFDPALKGSKSLFLSYEDQNEPVEVQVMAGELEIPHTETKLKALLVNLTQNQVPEYALVLKNDNSKNICGLKLIFDEQDFGLFLIFENDRWVPATTAVQAGILQLMEVIVSFGFLWHSLEEYKDLFKALTEIVDF